VGVPLRRRAASERLFDAGQRVGPYRVVRRVAPSCYDAETLESGLPVRIELAGADDTALIDVRFARACAQLGLVEHPCVARMIGHGVLTNGRPWVASARHPGTALSDVLAERRLLPHETVALIHSTASVLVHTHRAGIVHGALRPHHLTLSKGAKVTISGWAWLRTAGIPAYGDPVSTSVYSPPEHDGTSPIDGRADVYALGAIAYRALTGVFPDVSRDLIDSDDPLGTAIENMLALDVRDRASAAAIVADLAPLREQRRRATTGS
jgi:serine/threonine-protein kinase